MKRAMLLVAAVAAAVAALASVSAWAAGSPPPVNQKPYVYLSIDDVSATEGATAAMTIRAWPVVNVPIQVNWWTEDDTAVSPHDYARQSGTVTIPAGSSSVTCNVSTKQDVVHEHAEHFHVYISSPQVFVKITKEEADFTIADDDPMPTVQMADAPTITEGGELAYKLTLSNPTVDTVTVNVDPAGAGTSPTWNANDYSSSSGTLITFDPMASASYYTFMTRDDAVYEGQEHVWLHLTGVTNGQLPTDYTGWSDQTDAWANGIVNDNESPPVVAISDSSPLHATEGGDLVFTLTLSGASEQPVDVAIDPYGAGTSLSSADYSTAPATSVHFAPLATSVQYTLQTSDDTAYEGQEHVWLHLTGVTGGFMPATDWIGWSDATDAWAIGYLEDNDTQPIAYIGAGTTVGVCPIYEHFPVTLSEASTTAVQITLAVHGVYLRAGGTPDESTAGSWTGVVNVPAGETSATYVVGSPYGCVLYPWDAYAVDVTMTGADGALVGTTEAVHGTIVFPY